MSSNVPFCPGNAWSEGLDRLIKAAHHDQAYPPRQALAQYPKQHRWQSTSIQAGLADAMAGNLIDPGDIEAKWGA